MLLEENDNIKKLKNYVLHPNLLIHEHTPEFIPHIRDINSILDISEPPECTDLIPERDYFTGEIKRFIEVDAEDIDASATNSTSMQREPGLLEEVTRGSPMNYPFWPGGFDDRIEETIESLNEDKFDLVIDNYFTKPPGFVRGYDFNEELKSTLFPLKLSEQEGNMDVLKDFEDDEDVQEWFSITKEKDTALGKKSNQSNHSLQNDVDEKIFNDDLKPILKISEANIVKNTEWAEMVDISQPLTDFDTKIPCPAKTFPFELDVFQKQAILKLEKREYVFVAAHTSAGKTVVAEYAIALSQRDLTRTIYTSPIKALSNQKYRDFKTAFNDVGLITGDLQINPTATCLIMTTEVLRSMLYCGSDITRDLEYVIFDEVHYINNPERGHVWEEVIILLPNHVNIIMLSATVPNTMDLANWVGSTKKRKVYVISTLKRPVPLMHYLYTGVGIKSKDDDMFLIVDEKKTFLQYNYDLAVSHKNEVMSKFKKKTFNIRQEQDILKGLIQFLKRNNKMPVVTFTLSRNRCDQNANALQSIDLNSHEEKEHVKKFFKECLVRLKPPDRVLPQVLRMKDSLKRGIGVHHSGILPILKEIVELLFQSGMVKLLFATETFAMGVNMPARTVVFDSHRKFDGLEIRGLKPDEYIQMAGRAGRRGHDENGTVILLCKSSIPSSEELRPMVLGHPEKLTSHFILRYAVILTCLRIENIKVEDIMKFSFKEFNVKLQLPAKQKELKDMLDIFSKMPELGDNTQQLCKFYELAAEYQSEKQRLMRNLLSQAKFSKELKPGRVIVVTQRRHINKLGILLSMKIKTGKDTLFKVLVLDDKSKVDNVDKFRADNYFKILSLAPQNKFFHPKNIGGHTILDILPNDIVEVTKSHFKIDADLIIRNWEQRQIERFKQNPPGPTVLKVVADLHQLNENYNSKPDSLHYVSLTKDININAGDEIAQICYIDHLKSKLMAILPSLKTMSFEKQFGIVYDRKEMERKIEELKWKSSIKSLSLYPDYCRKLEILRALKYIDEYDEVALKGKIACEMGQNELLITELILCNMFNDLTPEAIAGLLSSLVFQGKTKEEPEIPENLKECVRQFEEIHNSIISEEEKYGVANENEIRLNFGLLEVIYEWARNKPFAEIMKLTEIQEGIIVRCIQQLDETLRDVKTAAIRIGNPALQKKMEEASLAIKRDIVFTPSLYTTT